MIKICDASISLSRDGQRKLYIDLVLNKRESAVILGSNGSGKSTILDTIVGIRSLDQGNIQVDRLNKPIAYVVQDSYSGLLPWYSILTNIMLPSISIGKGEYTKDRTIEILKKFGLDGRINDFPYKLSGGERQIINIVRALCTPADIVLLDEPYSPLNSEMKKIAQSEIFRYISDKTSIMITHDLIDLGYDYNKYYLINNNRLNLINEIQANKYLSFNHEKT